MKITELDLLAFGPFTDLKLDLAGGEEGLHFIYGPNEAGKSSALRAVRGFLYGIPERSDDDFRHAKKNLRIGATLQRSDGSVLKCIRRKGRSKTLRGADDQTVLEESEMAGFLAGVDEALFETMHGIDHARLVQGGREIVQGGGHLGEILFAAGSGIAELQGVQKRLQAEMEELFKGTNATKPKINAGLLKLREAKKALGKAQLSVDQWQRHEQSLREAERRQDELERELREKRSRQNRLRRIRDALQAIANWRAATRELEQYKNAILLPEDFGKGRNEALTRLRLARQQKQEAEESLEQTNRQLESLEVHEELLAEAEAVEDLYQRLGSHRKAQQDRPGLETARQQSERQAQEILQNLGRSAEEQEIQKLQIPEHKKVRIGEMANQQQGLAQALENARQYCGRLRRQIVENQQRLAEIEVPDDPGPLRRCTERLREEGNLERQLADLEADLHSRESEAEAAGRQLPLVSGSLDELEALAVPAEETIDRFEQEFQESATRLQSLQDKRSELEENLRRVDSQLQKLQRQQNVPSEEELHAARRRRQDGWRLIQQVWRDGEDPQQEIAAFAAEFGADDLATAYQQSVDGADQLADRLRREADNVARQAELSTHREQTSKQLRSIEETIGGVEAERAELERQWTAQWEAAGLTPLPPREMRPWLRQHRELKTRIAEIREKQSQANKLRTQIEESCRKLAELLQADGLSVADSDHSLTERLQQAEEHLDTIRRRTQEQDQLADRLEALHGELQVAETQYREAEENLRNWQQEWAAEMRRLGLEENASVSEANALLSAVGDLFEKLRDAEHYRMRIEGIDGDARQFETDVRRITRWLAPDLADKPVETAAPELHNRLAAAGSARRQRDALLAQQEDQQKKLGAAEEEMARAHSELDAMCQEAGCDDHAELPEAEDRSARRRQLENRAGELEEEIHRHSGGEPLEAFLAEAESFDPDTLQPQIDEWDREINTLNDQWKTVNQTVGSERRELAQMDGSATAAEKAEECEELVAGLQEEIEQYAVRRVASAVLRHAVERYRERNQGPVIQRASRLFRELTSGSFDGLRTDFDEKGEPVLFGVRAGTGETLGLGGMSDGTSDQLYLALRLASLQTWLQNHEPLPFIVDDILLNFDDQRAAAALHVLAELSTQTQVIFFSHHGHLLGLAREELDDEVLFIHELEPATVPA